MTRVEQAKKDCAIVVSDDMEYGTPFARGYNKGIEAGVKWADSNPNWHKYPEDKPKEYDDYTVYLEDSNGDFMMEIYEYDPRVGEFGYITIEECGSDRWVSADKLVKAWKELPKPPKFD